MYNVLCISEHLGRILYCSLCKDTNNNNIHKYVVILCTNQKHFRQTSYKNTCKTSRKIKISFTN